MPIIAPPPARLDPSAQFTLGGQPLGPTLADYWAWAHSGLLGKKERGILAEFLVAQALGIETVGHDPWGSFDLVSASGTTIEVKSSAHLQAWNQRKLFQPEWKHLRSRRSETTADGGWTTASNTTVKGEVVVLALFVATDHAAAEPLNADQWVFWLVPGREITTSSLRLSSVEARYRRLSFSEMRSAFAAVEQLLKTTTLVTGSPT